MVNRSVTRIYKGIRQLVGQHATGASKKRNTIDLDRLDTSKKESVAIAG